MKAVLAAFRSPLSDGSSITDLPLTEFSIFWKSLTKDEQEGFKAEAYAAGYKD